MRRLHSLQTKLTASFIVLVLVVSAGTFFYSLSESKKALREIVRIELTAVASMAAATLNGADGDALQALKPGDETSPQFAALKAKLHAMRASHPDFKYVYTMRQVGHEVRFIVDPEYGNATDPGAAIDEVYQSRSPEIYEGFRRPMAEHEPYEDKWGMLMSGFAPVKNSRGETIGLVGVDMSSDLVIAKQRYLSNTIYVIIGLGVLVAGLFIFAFSKTIIKDINRLNQVANQISTGDTNVRLDVSRKDEIGELADSFGRMVASLKIMMMQDAD